MERDNIWLLNEAARLIRSCPPKATFRHDTAENDQWLAEVDHFFMLHDVTYLDELNELIGEITQPRRGGHYRDVRRELLISLRSARRSLEYGLQAISLSDYVELSSEDSGRVQADLAQLKELVRGSNELDEESRQILLCEIAAFEATVIQPRLSAELITRFVNTVIGGASMKLLGSTADEISSRVANILLGYVFGAGVGS